MEGLRLRKWDALTGSKLAEFSCEDGWPTGHTGGRIIAYTVTATCKVIILSSNGSIVYLDRELKHAKTVTVAKEYILSGTVCVSNDGLVFVGMRSRNDKQAALRIYSAVEELYFDQVIEENLNTMEISSFRFTIFGVITSLHWISRNQKRGVIGMPTMPPSCWYQTLILNP